jgi:predicted RNase H-like nuclease
MNVPQIYLIYSTARDQTSTTSLLQISSNAVEQGNYTKEVFAEHATLQSFHVNVTLNMKGKKKIQEKVELNLICCQRTMIYKLRNRELTSISTELNVDPKRWTTVTTEFDQRPPPKETAVSNGSVALPCLK